MGQGRYAATVLEAREASLLELLRWDDLDGSAPTCLPRLSSGMSPEAAAESG